LIFANQTEDDILLKDELDALAAEHKNFKIYYSLDRVFIVIIFYVVSRYVTRPIPEY
jgi:NAD(P)H-flavin reductase